MRYSEILIEQFMAKQTRDFQHGDYVRKDLYTDRFNEVIKELEKNYKIEKKAIKHNMEYELRIDDRISFIYVLDTRSELRGGGFIYDIETILIRGLRVDNKERNKGYGSRFLSDLFRASKDNTPKMNYYLFPYMEDYNEEELIRLGKFYMRLGFFPLVGFLSNPEPFRPYIKQNICEFYDKGIRPLGWGDGLDKFKANPQDFSSLQAKYFL